MAPRYDPIPDIASRIRQQVNEAVILTAEEELALVRDWKDNQSIEARNKLVEAHQKLVAAMANKFSASGAAYEDLYNEGIIALISAAERFDVTRENRFSTYAAWWILSQLQEAVHRAIYTVKIGRSRAEKKALRMLGTARQILGASMDQSVIELISQETGCPIKTIERIEGAISSRSASLNARIGPDGEEGSEVGDLIECPSARDIGAEFHAQNRDQMKILEAILSDLKDPRAAKIIRERWLIADQKSLKEISDDLDISAERVRQIEREAMSQIKENLLTQGFDMADIIG